MNRTLESAATAGAARRIFKRKDADALEEALAILGVDVRYEIRAGEAQLKTATTDWAAFTDRTGAALRRKIARDFSYEKSRTGVSPLRYGLESWHENLCALLASREVDSFIVWLEALPPWDKVERVDYYLDDLFSVGNSGLARWVAQFFFVGPIERAYTPGAKLDETPVLFGEGGIGKSALLRALFPKERERWFSDGLHLAADPKVRVEALGKPCTCRGIRTRREHPSGLGIAKKFPIGTGRRVCSASVCTQYRAIAAPLRHRGHD